MALNKISAADILCEGFSKSGTGKCPYPNNCRKFHPRKYCSKGKSCNKNICLFLHDKEYYTQTETKCPVIKDKFLQKKYNINSILQKKLIDYNQILDYIGI